MQLFSRTTLALFNTLLAAQVVATKQLISITPYLAKAGESDQIHFAASYSENAVETYNEIIVYVGTDLEAIETEITAYETLMTLVCIPTIHTIQTRNADVIKTNYVVLARYL